jgi:hypothetical protein
MTDQAISPDKAISPLRRRMIEDMAIRKLAPKTQHVYVQRVKAGRFNENASLDEADGAVLVVLEVLDRSDYGGADGFADGED